jgi:hypothetical protein
MLLLNRFTSLMICLLLALAAGCGSSALDSNKVSPDGLVSGSVTRVELLSDLDALEPAAGVDAQDFASMKGALKAALLDSSTTKFAVHPPHGPGSTVTDLTLAILPDGSSGIQWTYVNPGDYNFDGQTNLHDLVNLGAFLGAVSGDERWDRAQYVDGDGNGAITIADITPIAVNFLGTVTAYQVEGAVDEESAFEQIEQLPYEAGLIPEVLHPREFYVQLGDPGKRHFRVATLDPAGTAGEYSFDTGPVVLKPNVKLVTYTSSEFKLLVRQGMSVTLDNLAGIPVNPGDILFNNDGGAFILRVDEVVADGTSITAHCAPASLNEALSRGAIDLTNVLQGIAPGGQLEPAMLCDEQGLHISIVGGSYRLDAAQARLGASYGAGGLTKVIGSFNAAAINFELDLHVENNGFIGGFPQYPQGCERLVRSGELDGSVLLTPGLEVGTLTTYKTYVGVEGEGEINGSYDFHYAVNSGEISARAEYAPGNGWETNYEIPLLESEPGEQQVTGGEGTFSLRPYLRMEFAVQFLWPPTMTDQPADFSWELKADLNQSAIRETTPVAGYDLGLTSNLEWRMAANLSDFSQNLSLPVSGRTGDESYHSQFVADPHLPTTRAIMGTAYDGSSPLAAVEITVRDSSSSELLGDAVTDGAGLYTVTGIADGASVVVSAALEGYQFSPQFIELTMDGDKAGANFFGSPAVGQTYGVSGFLSELELGTPIIGATVYLYDQGGLNQLGITETNSAGFYQFSGLSPFTTVRVQPSMSGYGFMPSYAEFAVTGELGQDFTGFFGESL